MTEGNYWTRAVSRRSLGRSAGLGIVGLASAALFGCGTAPATPAAEITARAGGTPAVTSKGKVSADQVRVKPGTYDGSPPPSPAEQDPLANGRYGGTLLTRYLDPPHMDFNRTLSCTINTTMDYTNNKLTRAKFGPLADITKIDIEPDLAESWRSTATRRSSRSTCGRV
ncbi:MAG: hypothetical protein U0360_06600 [Dehalococcoidia bacterium]